MNKWEEKNYTEQEKNCLSSKENAPSGSMNETRSGSTMSEWKDIGGVRKWIRNCPECGVEILCSTKRQVVKYTKKGIKCKACGYKNRIVPLPAPRPKRIPSKEDLTRHCPVCKIDLIYKTKCGRDAANKRAAVCKECQNKATRKYQTPDKLERSCPNCQCVMKYTNGKDLSVRRTRWLRDTKENRLCNRCARSGNRNGMAGVYRNGKDNPNFGKRWSSEQKERMRKISTEKFIERGYTFNNYNPDACKYFDILSEERGWELRHAENGGEVVINGYFLDAYDEKRNIVVEYDEPHHYVKGNLKKKDIDRMNNIIQATGCKFYRYNEKTKEFYECKPNFNSTSIV
jgi:hypothetical protein